MWKYLDNFPYPYPSTTLSHLGKLYPIIISFRKKTKQVNSYSSLLVPESTRRTQVNSDPSQLRPKSTQTQVNSFYSSMRYYYYGHHSTTVPIFISFSPDFDFTAMTSKHWEWDHSIPFSWHNVGGEFKSWQGWFKKVRAIYIIQKIPLLIFWN